MSAWIHTVGLSAWIPVRHKHARFVLERPMNAHVVHALGHRSVLEVVRGVPILKKWAYDPMRACGLVCVLVCVLPCVCV